MPRQYFEDEKEYENECARIIREYPDQIKKVFSHPMCQYDYTFLGFLDVYASIPELPEDFIIIDFGCYLGVQAIYFQQYQSYIGVDTFDILEYAFQTENNTYYQKSIQDFIKDMHNLDLNKCFAICSYVPDENARQLVINTFPYHKVQYCDDIISENYPKTIDYDNKNFVR